MQNNVQPRSFLNSAIGLTAGVVLLMFAALPATAQTTGGSVAIGGQIGSPSGVTLKFQNPGISYEFLAAFDLDNFFFVNLHGLFNTPLQAGENFYLFYGPGVYVGFRDSGPDDDVVVGISVTGGLSYYFSPFEAYIRLTPRLDILPGTDGSIGGGLGLRYYF